MDHSFSGSANGKSIIKNLDPAIVVASHPDVFAVSVVEQVLPLAFDSSASGGDKIKDELVDGFKKLFPTTATPKVTKAEDGIGCEFSAIASAMKMPLPTLAVLNDDLGKALHRYKHKVIPLSEEANSEEGNKLEIFTSPCKKFLISDFIKLKKNQDGPIDQSIGYFLHGMVMRESIAVLELMLYVSVHLKPDNPGQREIRDEMLEILEHAGVSLSILGELISSLQPGSTNTGNWDEKTVGDVLAALGEFNNTFDCIDQVANDNYLEKSYICI